MNFDWEQYELVKEALTERSIFLQDLNNFSVICHDSALLDGSKGKCNIDSCIITLPIIIDNGSYKVVFAEHRKSFKRLVSRDKITALKATFTSEEVINLTSYPIIRNLVPLVEGKHDGKLLDQMRGHLEED